jgi:hypothetical protein
MAAAASGPVRPVLALGQRVLALPEANVPAVGNVPAAVSALVALAGVPVGVRVATAGAEAEARHTVAAMATGQPPRQHARRRSR